VLLSELTAPVKRLALVGLAKNTGKTETLAALLRELQDAGRCVGVTSVGRDGEERDVIDSRIEKPRVRLAAGSLVATTDGLLRASAIPHEVLETTSVRTPLGRVLIARLGEPGAIEVAGPSAAGDVRTVSDAMLAHGAEQVLVDGAVDRRAASSPAVSDGLVVATGAVLSPELDEVVAWTKDALDLVRLPEVDDPRLRALAEGALIAGAHPHASASGEPGGHGPSLLVSADYETVELPPRFVLTSGAEEIAAALDASPQARWLIVAGALPDRFLRGALHPVHRRHRELVHVVADPTKVFLSKRGPGWYRRQGVHIETLNPIALRALTVNPVAPQSHSFDSVQLRARLREEIDDVPTFDILHPDYRAAESSAGA
jgi:hypothetical protein